MLPACLPGMILVVNEVTWNFSSLNRSQEIGQERLPKGGGWASAA